MAQADDLKKLQDALRSGDHNPNDIQDELVRSGYKPSDAQAMMRQAMGGDGGSGGATTPGFFGEMYNQLINPLVKGGEGVWDSLKNGLANPTQAPSTPQQQMQSGQTGFRDYLSNIQQALQAKGQFSGESLGARGPQAAAQTLGGLFPPIGAAGSNLHQGNYAAAGGDAASAALQLFGPKLMEKGLGGVRSLGAGGYEDSFGFPPTQKSPSVADMLGMAHDNNITISAPGMAKLRSILDDSMATADKEISSRPGVDIQSREVMKNLGQHYSELMKNAEQSSPDVDQILKVYNDYMSTYGDTIGLKEAQALKKATWKRLSDPVFQKIARGDPTVAGRQAALFERGEGLKNSIEDAVGPNSPLGSANKTSHVAMGLMKRIDELTADQKGMLVRAAPALTGAAALGGAGMLGLDPGSHISVIAGLGGLGAYFAKKAMEDPAVMSRVSNFMSRMGTGATSQTLANAPRVAALAKAYQSSSGSGNGQTQ